MSIRSEQYHALLYSRQLLFEMLDCKRRPKTVKELNMRIRFCLRHFPYLKKDGEPVFSKL